MIFDNQISWDGISLIGFAIVALVRFTRVEEKTKSNSHRISDLEKVTTEISHNQSLGMKNLEVLTTIVEERTNRKIHHEKNP